MLPLLLCRAGVGGLDSGWLDSNLLGENAMCEIIHTDDVQLCNGGRKCIKILVRCDSVATLNP